MKRAGARLIREATEWRCEWRRARPYVNRTGPSAREPLSLSLSPCRAREARGRGREASILEKEKERRKKKPAAAAAARAGCQLQKQCRHRHRRDKHAFIPESVVCARRRGRMRYSPGSPDEAIAHARVLYGLSRFTRFRSVRSHYRFFLCIYFPLPLESPVFSWKRERRLT